jgi:hypothetical protein
MCEGVTIIIVVPGHGPDAICTWCVPCVRYGHVLAGKGQRFHARGRWLYRVTENNESMPGLSASGAHLVCQNDGGVITT